MKASALRESLTRAQALSMCKLWKLPGRTKGPRLNLVDSVGNASSTGKDCVRRRSKIKAPRSSVLKHLLGNPAIKEST